MAKINISTAKEVKPMIYAYTTPGVTYHDGWTKIGYTEKDVDKRVKEQTHTAGIKAVINWRGTAIFDDGSFESFTDHELHAYMCKRGVERGKHEDTDRHSEWMHIEPEPAKQMYQEFKSDRWNLDKLDVVVPYTLREEQEQAVNQTIAYRNDNEQGEFLWNAKPRFGKTLSVYDFCKRIKAQNVLIVTNRPAIANSWYDDYIKFVGTEDGYLFVSEVDALKGREGVLSRQDFIKAIHKRDYSRCIEFVSLQDMKGSVHFGGHYDKLAEVAKIDWDILVIDEAHEGVDTYKTDVAFDRINRKFTLHLSGTPFKTLANSKFPDNAIFNWTYADEQKKKKEWNDGQEDENPYATLPRLNLFTYQMSEIIKDEIKQGIEINGETEEYAFDLNEFFRVENGRFVYDSSVDRFLDALTTQTKFPFSTDDLRDELKHTFWLLNRVESARLMAKKLENHPVFKDYQIILAAGDGKIDDDDENRKSYDKVVDAIAEYDKTITLSVGQLTTGITIPEWTAVLMLSNVKSPSLYMQAAFRAQNPCLFQVGKEYKRKENAYVFDFDPARTLMIFEEFANDLYSDTAGGRGDTDARKQNIRTLLNFFPVVGEDDQGEMVELDAEKVLSIPRKIRSQEVVRRGFMSNFLFQNIANVFGAPKEVLDIINQFEAIEEPAARVSVSDEVAEELSLDENGDVVLDEQFVSDMTEDLFGKKIYDTTEIIQSSIEKMKNVPSDTDKAIKELKHLIHEKGVQEIVESAKDTYGDEMRTSDRRQIESKLKAQSDALIERTIGSYNIEKNIIEQERKEALQHRDESGKTTKQINKEFDARQKEAEQKLRDDLNEKVSEFMQSSGEIAVETVETNKREREKKTIEDGIRDHLRGFSRTIPSFLMAYGDDTVTLATFDTTVPDNVFLEVTSITLDQFRFLRDGGDYTDAETGEKKRFDGQLFDPVVFDDSVKEFLRLKKKLADYFDEKSVEDIFDYIPPQKTNQIFTPKNVVQRMVDMLEEENPGCFDEPDKTFIDLYMKSGLYITEIVKRLYQSKKLKKLYPDDEERLKHIFEKQVYGLAPTEIIYKIATSYILGFDENTKIKNHNFRKADALPYAKEGRLQELLDELYPDDVK